jgi:hypothetical protein
MAPAAKRAFTLWKYIGNIASTAIERKAEMLHKDADAAPDHQASSVAAVADAAATISSGRRT